MQVYSFPVVLHLQTTLSTLKNDSGAQMVLSEKNLDFAFVFLFVKKIKIHENVVFVLVPENEEKDTCVDTYDILISTEIWLHDGIFSNESSKTEFRYC